MKMVCTTVFVLFAALGIALTVLFIAYYFGAQSSVVTGSVVTILTLIAMALLIRGMTRE